MNKVILLVIILMTINASCKSGIGSQAKVKLTNGIEYELKDIKYASGEVSERMFAGSFVKSNVESFYQLENIYLKIPFNKIRNVNVIYLNIKLPIYTTPDKHLCVVIYCRNGETDTLYLYNASHNALIGQIKAGEISIDMEEVSLIEF